MRRSQVIGAGQGRRLFQGGAQESLRQLWIGGRLRLLGETGNELDYQGGEDQVPRNELRWNTPQ